jgi:hypothetical protein
MRGGIFDNAFKNELGDATSCMTEFYQIDKVFVPWAALRLGPLKDSNYLLHGMPYTIGVLHFHHHKF